MRKQSLETIALLILLAAVGLRPLISETYDTAQTDVSAALLDTSDAWASTTLIIDAVILVVAAIVLMQHPFGGSRGYIVCGLELGAALLLVSAAVACVLAGRHRIAVNASVDLLAMLVAVIVLAQLLDSGWKLRLAIAIVIASGAANAAECFDQHFNTFQWTEEDYFKNREEFWTRQGVELDAPEVKLFERRMLAREADGFFSHSNVAGAFLLVSAFAALGAGIGAVRGRHDNWRALAISFGFSLAGFLFVAMTLTHSKGAIAAGCLALVLLVLRLVFAGKLGRWRGQVFFVCWTLIVVAILGVVALGLINDGLPGASLDFRWDYWTASAAMFRDHLAGVGPQNFGDHYLQYKAITSPEEVKNPHNFIVQFATEMGASGLIALILMIFGALSAATRRVDWHDTAFFRSTGSADDRPTSRTLAAGIALGIGMFLVRIPLLPSNDPAFVTWSTVFPLLVWLVAFGLALAALRVASTSAWGIAALAAGINAGLFAFLLQDTINFALFTPGAAMAFFGLLAVSVAMRSPAAEENATAHNPVGSFGFAAAGALAVAIALALVAPVRAECHLRAARALAADTLGMVAAEDTARISEQYRAAIVADPLDATAPTEYAEWLTGIATTEPEETQLERYTEAEGVLHTALRRARFSFGLYRRMAGVYVMLGRLEDKQANYERAVAAMQHAIALYPSRPMSYVELGDCLAALGGEDNLRKALDEYRHALSLNDQRPDWEQLRRFTDRQVDEVQERIRQVETQLGDNAQ